MSIEKINAVVATYFEENKEVNWIPVKDMMNSLIQAGVFTKDVKKGLPIRKILRKLDADNQLSSIPLIHAERLQGKVYWYFVKEGAVYESKYVISPLNKKERGALLIEQSDEFYLVNLCDEILNKKAVRKHTFDNLLGNMHKRGKGRTKLPLAAYYEDLKLVIEFAGKKTETDKRQEQLRIYALRKKEVLERKKINLVVINYTDFESNEDQDLKRDTDQDLIMLKKILKKHI